MEAASKIQTLFWPSPPQIGGDSHLWGVSIPASFAGGDLYDWIPMPDKTWLVYVADVSDKGLPAALIMTALWSRIRSEAIQHQQVSHLLAAVNEAMVELLSDEGFFASVIMAKYDPAAGRVTLATAGHLPPLWLCEGVLRPPPLSKSVSLGVVAGAQFEETELLLAPGDALLFMTDGVTEAIDQQENLFGQAGIDRFVAAHQGPPWGEGLVAAVRAHSEGVAAFDDLTVVEIWRDP
jgi:serine phosphatase RsbU (regulator of sigma subunit)